MMRQLVERRDRRARAEAHLVVDGGQLGATVLLSLEVVDARRERERRGAPLLAREARERRFASGEAASAAAALSCSLLGAGAHGGELRPQSVDTSAQPRAALQDAGGAAAAPHRPWQPAEVLGERRVHAGLRA